MSCCKERLWPYLMRLKLVNGNVNRVVLHCQCHHLRAAKPALTALLRKHSEVKHLKLIINSLIKLDQTKEESPAVSFNHSHIKVRGLLVDGSFLYEFSFFKSTSWHYHKTVTEDKLRENFFLRGSGRAQSTDETVYREQKWNKEMGAGSVLNRGHEERSIVRDCKCFNKRQNTLIEQTCKSTGDCQKKRLKFGRRYSSYFEGRAFPTPRLHPSAPAVCWSSLFSTVLHAKDEIMFCLFRTI